MQEKKKRTRKKAARTSYDSIETPIEKIEEQEKVLAQIKPVVSKSEKVIFTSGALYKPQFKKDGSIKVWKFYKGNAFRVPANDQEEIEYAESQGYKRV